MTTRVAMLDIIVVGFTDAEGALEYQPIEERSEIVGPFVGVNENEEHIFFESEAQRLPDWCEANGFKYFEGQIEAECILEAQ